MDLIFESQTKIDPRRVNMKILNERCLCLCDLTNLRLCIGLRGPINLQLIALAQLHVVSKVKTVDAKSQMIKRLGTIVWKHKNTRTSRCVCLKI